VVVVLPLLSGPSNVDDPDMVTLTLPTVALPSRPTMPELRLFIAATNKGTTLMAAVVGLGWGVTAGEAAAVAAGKADDGALWHALKTKSVASTSACARQERRACVIPLSLPVRQLQ